MTIAKHTLDVTINTHGNKHEVECYFDKGISPHSEKTRPVTFSKNNLGVYVMNDSWTMILQKKRDDSFSKELLSFVQLAFKAEFSEIYTMPNIQG